MRRGNVLNLWNAVWHHCFARGFGTEGTEKFEVLSMFSYIELQASEKYLWTCILNEKPTLATALINNFVRYCHRRRQDIDVYYRFPRWKRLRGKFGHPGRMKCQLGKYYVVVVTTWFFVKKKLRKKSNKFENIRTAHIVNELEFLWSWCSTREFYPVTHLTVHVRAPRLSNQPVMKLENRIEIQPSIRIEMGIRHNRVQVLHKQSKRTRFDKTRLSSSISSSRSDHCTRSASGRVKTSWNSWIMV